MKKILKTNRKIILQLFGGRGASSFKIRKVHGFSTKIHSGRQAKHIESSHNYIEGRSKLTISESKAQELINKHAGSKLSRWNGNHKEIIDFGEVIGECYNSETGKWEETTWGTIHYSNKGTHLVPTRPNKY